MQKVALLVLLASSALLSVTAQPSAACTTFCNAFAPCYTTPLVNPNAAWTSGTTAGDVTCLALCATWGTGAATTGNTVACRQAKLTAVSPVTQASCNNAAHVTSDNQCGDAQAVYCDGMSVTCPSQYAATTSTGGCLSRSTAAVLPYTYPAATVVATGYGLACRLYHHAVAATGTTAAATHCPHAGPLNSNSFLGKSAPFESYGVCGTPCESYCYSIQAACGGTGQANTQFPDMQTCMKTCNGTLPNGGHYFAVGAEADTAGDTFYCRHYHAQVALQNAAAANTHCAHAGQTGGGAAGPCSDSCQSFCDQNALACAGQTATFAKWGNTGGVATTNCTYECNVAMAADATYPAATVNGQPIVSGDSLSCRAYHSRVAQTDSPAGNAALHCPHALPQNGGTCGTDCDTFCSHSGAFCGWTGPNSQWATKAACVTACTAFPTTGALGDTSGNTFNCRWYHLNVARSGGALATLHCPHTATASATCAAPPAGSSTAAAGGDASTLAVPTTVLAVLAIASVLKF